MAGFCCAAAAVPGLRREELLPGGAAVGPALLAAPSRAGAGAGESCTGFSVEHIHLVLVQTFGAAELEPFLTGAKVQVLFSVADMFAPVTDSNAAVDLQHQSGRVLRMGVLGRSLTVEVFISGLVSFEVGASAGGETLLAAEALEL